VKPQTRAAEPRLSTPPSPIPIVAAGVIVLVVACGGSNPEEIAPADRPADDGAGGEAGALLAPGVPDEPEPPGEEEVEPEVPQEWHDAPASLREHFRVASRSVVLDSELRFPRRIERTGLDLPFVYVRSGTFQLGSPAGEEGRFEDEEPLTRVGIEGFYLSRTEISYSTWRAGGGRKITGIEETHPAAGITWREAYDWCEANGLSLPSEAQWEYAASGALNDVFPWGSRPDRRLCNARGTSSHDLWVETSPVGSMPTDCSWCGALDMAGNVMEWCLDGWQGSYEEVGQRAVNPVLLPPGDQPEGERVVRGGSYHSRSADQIRTAYRNSILATDIGANLGFRAIVKP
jgi:formylglycine-generating enzyme required for sulfatase activity